MLVIRLSRVGRKKYPLYRVVAADKRRAVQAKFVTILGHYNPHTKKLVLETEKVVDLLSKGAQPSNSVIKLLQKEKIDVPVWAKLKTRNRPAKKTVDKAEPTTEASVVEKAEDKTKAQTEQPAGDEAIGVETATAAAEVKDDLGAGVSSPETGDELEQAKATQKQEEAAGDAAVETAKQEKQPKTDSDKTKA